MRPAADESALERDGARAAAARRSWQTNPFLQRANMPVATGETLREWSRKHDAWQRGFEGMEAPALNREKERLPPELLATIVERRLRWIPQVRSEIERDVLCELRLSPPRAHERDADRRNWDLAGFECGPIDASACPVEFRVVVDRARDQYDISTAA